MSVKNIITQIKEGAEFTFRGFPARFVGARIDQEKVAIEFNQAAGPAANAFWNLASVKGTDPELALVKRKVSVFVNVYEGPSERVSAYGHPTKERAENAAGVSKDVLVRAHEVVIEL